MSGITAFRGRLFVTVLAGISALWCTGAPADEADPAMQAYAHRLAVGVCGVCHGPRGNGTQPKFPRLAGQNPNYLVAQLKNFRGQTRGDPDAIARGYLRPAADAVLHAIKALQIASSEYPAA